MTIYALILFSVSCGIPCEPLEPAAGPYTFDECRSERQAAMTRYIMNRNERIWAVCIAED